MKLARIHFYTSDPNSGVYGLPMYQAGRPTPLRYDDADIDDLCRLLNDRKRSRHRKESIARQKEQQREWNSQESVDRHLAERRPDAIDYAEFLDKERRGVKKMISTL